MMVNALIAILVGIVALAVAWGVNLTFPGIVKDFNGALGLATDVFGFFGISLAVAKIGNGAIAPNGFSTLDAKELQGTAALGVIGAILLAA